MHNKNTYSYPKNDNAQFLHKEYINLETPGSTLYADLKIKVALTNPEHATLHPTWAIKTCLISCNSSEYEDKAPFSSLFLTFCC